MGLKRAKQYRKKIFYTSFDDSNCPWRAVWANFGKQNRRCGMNLTPSLTKSCCYGNNQLLVLQPWKQAVQNSCTDLNNPPCIFETNYFIIVSWILWSITCCNSAHGFDLHLTVPLYELLNCIPPSHCNISTDKARTQFIGIHWFGSCERDLLFYDFTQQEFFLELL